MKIENPYFDMWKFDSKTGKGKAVSLNEIVGSNCDFIFAIDQLVKGASIVGQYDLWGDCFLRQVKPDDCELEIADCLPVASAVIMGQEIKILPEVPRNQIAFLISNELTKHPNTMFQYSPEDIMKSMQEGRAIICLDKQTSKLLAFGQIWHYGQNLEGQYVYEFGSWLSFAKGGFGSEVLNNATKLHHQKFPSSQLVAIVEYYNLIAQRIIEQSGGTLLSYKYSEYLKTQDGMPAFMRIYDITQNKDLYEKS